MTFPEGTWTTEYAVRVTLPDGGMAIVSKVDSASEAEAARRFHRQCFEVVEAVTCEVFRTGWRPVEGDSNA